MQDSELIERVRDGDREAFGPLVVRHQERIFQLCYRVAGNLPDAEELAHEAFVEAYLKLYQLRDPQKFGPWLKALALNLCRMWYRERKRNALPLDEALVAPSVEEDRSVHARMFSGISQLSAAHRLALVLHYWEGLSYDEVARFLDVPIGTVMSRLHRARRELRQRMEKMDAGEEMVVIPDEAFKQEVEAEINVLMGMFGEEPEARERLSVLLRRSPERFAQLVEQAADQAGLADLALLLRRLGAPVMEVTLASYASGEPALRRKVVTLLQQALAGGRPSRTGLAAARIARREAYLLLDSLLVAATDAGTKAALLLELLDGRLDEQTALLLTNALLCWPGEALPLLMERFWRMADPEALRRQPDLLYALSRTGSRFAAALGEALRDGDTVRRALALEGADALARALTGSGLDLRRTPDERVALAARFRRKWAPPLSGEREPEVIEALAERVAAFLDDKSAPPRDKALRILGLLQASAHHAQIAAHVRHICPSTRLAALRALAELGDSDAAPLLLEVGQSGSDEERAAAAWGLGRLQAAEAVPLLLEWAGDPRREVHGAAVSALGEIGGDAARAGLEVLARASQLYAGRSLRRIAVQERQEVPPSQPERPRMEDRVRGGAEPPFYIALDAAIRALPALQPYGEAELSRLIAQLCRDYASTRRYLVDEGLMTREAGVYQFTEPGAAVWRVERFIRDRYMARG